MTMTMMYCKDTFRGSADWLEDFLSIPRIATWSAWIDGSPRVAHLPLLAWTDGEGHRHYESHCPVADSFSEALVRGTPLLGVVMGPQAFISSSWCANRSRAPTWNYIAMVMHATAVMQSQEETIDNLARLSQRADLARPSPWQISELGEQGLSQRVARIAGFSLDVISIEAKFKLGQDEPVEELPHLLSALRHEGQEEIVQWMSRAFAAR